MIRAAQPSISHTTTSPMKLKSFVLSLILVIINLAINTFVFTKFPTYAVTSIQTTVCVLTITSTALLLASIGYACTVIISLLKTSTNYIPKEALHALVMFITASYVCLCIALSILELSNANLIALIIMNLELPVLVIFKYFITRIYNIESRLNQTRTARAAHNMLIRANSRTTIDSGYMSGVSSYSGSNLSIQYDEVSLSMPPDIHEDQPHIPYIDEIGSQGDLRTAMTTHV